MIIFQDYVPNLLASPFFGGAIHRFSNKLSLGLSDNSLINQVLDSYTIDVLYTVPMTVRKIAEQAKINNFHFIIINDSQYNFEDIPPGFYGKISGACASALERLGLTKDNSAISIMNEPNKIGDENWYLDCVDWSNYYVKGRYPLILINDEYYCYNNNYILENTGYIKNRLFGVHLLSCLGYPPKLKNVEYAANTAAKWGIPVICSEGGSWFKSYDSPEGFEVIKNLIDKCSEFNYFGCAIVMPDISITAKKRWPQLGFRVWTDDYKNLKSESKYWNDFVNYIKEFKDIEKPIIERKDGMIIPTQTINSYEVYLAELENELLWKLGYLKEEDITWSVTQKTVNALKLFQNNIINKYPKIMVDGKCGGQTFRYLTQEIPDSIERDNYRFALEIYASPKK